MNAAPPSDPASPPASSRARSWPRRIACLVLLAASVFLTTFTHQRLHRGESTVDGAGLAILPPAELDARRHDVVGTFATGTEPGDRVIVVRADGSIRFHFVAGGPLETRDSYSLAQREKRVCVVTRENGIVDALDIDRLAFSGDLYRRTK